MNDSRLKKIDDQVRNYLALPFALLAALLMLIAKLISPEHVETELNIGRHENE